MKLETDNPQATKPLDVAAVGNIVRDEIDRRDKYLEFAQDQVEKIGGLYKTLLIVTGLFISAITIAAATFSYKSTSDMKAEMRADMVVQRNEMKDHSDAMNHEIEAELARDNKAMEEMRVDLGTAKNNAVAAQVNVKNALDSIHKEVEGKLNTEFSNESITQLMRSVSTEKVKDIVIKDLAPITHIETQTTLALADNRQAFDYLQQIKLGLSPESNNPELRKMAEFVTEKIIEDNEADKTEIAYPDFTQVAHNSMGDIMAIKNPIIRQMSLDNFLKGHPINDKSVLPMLVEMIKSDSSINVLYAAVKWFNTLTNQKLPFKFYQEKEIQDWWGKNKASFQ